MHRLGPAHPKPREALDRLWLGVFCKRDWVAKPFPRLVYQKVCQKNDWQTYTPKRNGLAVVVFVATRLVFDIWSCVLLKYVWNSLKPCEAHHGIWDSDLQSHHNFLETRILPKKKCVCSIRNGVGYFSSFLDKWKKHLMWPEIWTIENNDSK